MKSKNFIWIKSLVIIVLVLSQLLMACGSVHTLSPAVAVTPQPSPTQLSASSLFFSQTTTSTVTSSATANNQSGVLPSYITAKSLNELVTKSTVIVTGQVSSVGGTSELLDNSQNNSSQSTHSVREYGQIYHFVTSNYYKGSSDKTIDIVQVEAAIVDVNQTTPTSDEVEKAKAHYPHIALRQGVTYLLFLNPIDISDKGANKSFAGTMEPWKFVLPTSGNVQIESSDHYAANNFPPTTTTDLLSQIVKIVNQNHASVPVATVPIPTPTPNIVAGQSVNLVKLYNLDSAHNLFLKGAPIEQNNGTANLKQITNILNKDLPVLENPRDPDLSMDVVFIIFIFSDDTTIGLDYNVKTSTIEVELADRHNRIKVSAPSELLQALGLGNT